MRTARILFTTVLCIILHLSTNGQNINTFRKTYWGMSKAEVLKSELPRKGVVSKVNTDVISFAGIPLGEVKANLTYDFTENALCRSRYYYRPANVNEYSAIFLYMETKEGLTQKYGDPLEPESATLEELVKKAPAHDLYINLYDGDPIEFYHAWETASTIIVLSYWKQKEGSKDQNVMMVDYYGRYAKRKEYKTKKAPLSDL